MKNVDPQTIRAHLKDTKYELLAICTSADFDSTSKAKSQRQTSDPTNATTSKDSINLGKCAISRSDPQWSILYKIVQNHFYRSKICKY